jgi:dihydroorotate dehydrogenase electron transfer subunit
MKRVEDFTVLGQQWINYQNFVLHIEAPGEIPDIVAGNFAEIEIPNSSKVFLRRPFSIFDANKSKRSLSFYVKIVGEGTRLLGEARKGSVLNLIYPLGNRFTVPQMKHALIVAGGSGLAPFVLLGRELRQKGIRVYYLLGGRDSDSIVLTERLKEFGEVHITTEDGSIGEKGIVTQHSILNSGELPFDMIYTCGPDPMMKAIAHIARAKEIPCEASLENTMGCGFGACLCCTVATVEGNKNVCTAGPVFNTNYLKW